MKRRKLLAVFGCICLIVMLAVMPVLIGDAQAARKIHLRLGTNPVGSIMYVFGSGISAVVGKYTSIEIENFPEGNLVALPMFSTKECDLAISAADELHAAYIGKGPYEMLTRGKGINLRLVQLGCRIPAGQVVAEDSGIKTYEDLKGKRVCLDFGVHYALSMGSRAALYGGGLTEDDVIVMKANSVPDAARMVIEGKADACYGAVGVPIFKELDVARGARHLGIEDTPEIYKKIHKIFHGYFPMKIKPGPVGVREPIVLNGRNFSLVARPDLSDKMVYEITKSLWEHDKELGPYHPRLKDWTKKRFVARTAPAPYHPGAIKFYKEVGVWTKEMENAQEELLAKKK